MDNKVIIAGSRTIDNKDLIFAVIKESGFKIDIIISGLAHGPDIIGKEFGLLNNIPVSDFPARWNDLTETPCLIKINKFGKKYNALAGHNRNDRMAKEASHLILIWDGVSSGSKNMLELAKKYNLVIFQKII